MASSTIPHSIRLSKDVINKIDLSDVKDFISWHTKNSPYFLKNGGEEIYKLLTYLSSNVLKNEILDIGTSSGFSALALAFNDNRNVITYDISDCIPDDQLTIKNKGNIEFKCMDSFEDITDLSKCDLIFLDIDHSGFYEKKLYELFIKLKFRGILVIDNILFCQALKEMWSEINLTKFDVTSYGHWTGTGLVVFDPSRYAIVLE